MPRTQYTNPLNARYASKSMQHIFSDDFRFSTWRKCWIALAKAQRKLGVAITQEQIDTLIAKVNTIDFEKAAAYEKEMKHDVMAHIHTFGDAAPTAKPILHLGATSAFVVDNTDIIQTRKALLLCQKYIVTILDVLNRFIQKYKDLPTLGYTHFQPAQLTTVGKRASLWASSLLMDIEELHFVLSTLKLRGAKGTTGTGASYKQLLNDDFSTFEQLNKEIAIALDFPDTYAVCGQTYDRKIDARTLNLLGQIAQSAHKITNDIRLLASLKQIEEPFAEEQIGSSAMPYKRNPVKSERIASLAKFVLSLSQSTAVVASTQWLERSLDDSANKRLSLPQAFLATDAMLRLLYNVLDGLVVYPNTIKKHINEELPFMITEHIIIEGVKVGGDRQQLHEHIRKHALDAGRKVKEEGVQNDLLHRLAKDKLIPFNLEELKNLCNPTQFIGFSEEQCKKFSKKYLVPLLEKHKNQIGMQAGIHV